MAEKPFSRFKGSDYLTLLLLLTSIIGAFSMIQNHLLHGNDFKHLWAGSYALRNGLDPYNPQVLFAIANKFQFRSINPFVYLPSTGIALFPYSLIPYPVSKICWFWTNWIVTWVMVLLGPAWLRLKNPGTARLACAVLVTAGYPWFRQMTAGQMNIITTALILWAAGALIRNRPGMTALALATGFAWKISPALLIACMFPMRRNRIALLGILFSLVLMTGSILISGAHPHRQSIEIIGQMRYGHSTWEHFGNDFHRDPFNQSVNSLLHHLLTNNPHTEPWIIFQPQVADRLTLAISILLLFTWIYGALNIRYNDPLSMFFGASLLMLLLPSLMWDHYTIQALPALMWLFGQDRTIRRPHRLAIAVLILTFLTIPWNHGFGNWKSGAGILMMSIRLWPILALYLWLTLDYPETMHPVPSRFRRVLNSLFSSQSQS
jgi:hypothetical protein